MKASPKWNTRGRTPLREDQTGWPERPEIVEAGIDETLSDYAMPAEHWRCLRTNNVLERLMREIRRRTRFVGAFSDGKSALMLVAARLRHVAASHKEDRKREKSWTLPPNSLLPHQRSWKGLCEGPSDVYFLPIA
jgi:transposase-like protein